MTVICVCGILNLSDSNWSNFPIFEIKNGFVVSGIKGTLSLSIQLGDGMLVGLNNALTSKINNYNIKAQKSNNLKRDISNGYLFSIIGDITHSIRQLDDRYHQTLQENISRQLGLPENYPFCKNCTRTMNLIDGLSQIRKKANEHVIHGLENGHNIINSYFEEIVEYYYKVMTLADLPPTSFDPTNLPVCDDHKSKR